MSRSTFRLLRSAGGAVLIASALAPAAGVAATPASGFEQFTGCPDRDDIQACQVIDVAGGSLGLGRLEVPIAQPLHFAGGASNTDAGSFFVAESGRVLAPTALPIAGGAAGLTGDADGGADAVAARVELTADPEFTVDGIRASVRIAFEGAGLPDGCGIGTADAPLVLDLTNATTTPPDGTAPISGDAGTPSFDAFASIVSSEHVLFVDNAYAVPAVSGCGSTIGGREVGSVDDLVNASAGLPAPAGASQTFLRESTVRAAFDRAKVFGR
ncbi:MAG: hypothetical protein PGN13_01110 [Patulibacter minatonensis]